MKKQHQILIIAILSLAVLIISCSDLKKDLPTATSAAPKIHEASWNDTTSAQFHGKLMNQVKYDFSSCVSCHSKQYTGGTSNVSCYRCHGNYPHKAEWTNTSADSSHGKYLKVRNWQSAECASCHGLNYGGGTSEKACASCHTYYPHLNYRYGHISAIRLNGYPLAQCKSCHGNSYTGGSVVNVSCSSSGCHVDGSGNSKSPEACNTCHGNFRGSANDLLTAAPPKSIAGDTLTTVAGVGAHQKHLATNTFGKAVKCVECHIVPATIFANGHLGSDLKAEVAFNDTLARISLPNGQPAYNDLAKTCANTYCHGNWKVRKATSSYQFVYSDTVMVGTFFSPLWTGGATEASCGRCHGNSTNPVPAGHNSYAITACANCHTGVIDNTGKIIDKTKHINGKINVFGVETSF